MTRLYGLSGHRRGRTVLAAVGYHHRLDGAARSFLNLVTRLPDAGWRPICVFLGEGPCVEAFREAGIDVRVLHADRAFDRFNKAWLGRHGTMWRLRALGVGLPQLAVQMVKLMRDEGVSVVHCNESRALFALGLAPRLAGVPTVLHVRGSLRPLPRALRTAAQRVPDRLILVGKALEVEIDPSLRTKARVIYNSVTVPDSVATPTRGKRPIRILTLAAFEPFKGYHQLAAAVPRVVARAGTGEVEFRWLGNTVDSEYVDHVRALLASSGAADVVNLGGWIPDVTEELESADIVVLPTIEDEVMSLGGREVRVQSSEGVPRCLLEASAFGRPTVSTRVGGIPEAVIDGSTGLLVPPSDPRALADAIVRLVDDEDLRSRMGEAGRRHVAAHFSHEALVESVVRVYDEVSTLPTRVAA